MMGTVSSIFRRERNSMFCLAVTASIGLGIVNGCSHRHEREPIGFARPVAPKCEPRRDDVSFFPARTFSVGDDDGTTWRDTYASLLAAADEPSMFCGESIDEGFRVVLLEPFREGAVVVRISRSNQAVSLMAYGLHPDGPAAPASKRVNKVLTQQDWETVAAAFETSDFWFMPTLHIGPQIAVLDASTWLIEGRRSSFYHAIIRTSYQESGAFVRACRLFFTFAGVMPSNDLGSETKR